MVAPPNSRGSISGGSITGGFPPQSGPSETDGDTDNFTDDFGDYEEWDYQEMLAAVGKQLKKFVMQPMLIGAAAAYGMSVGYAAFDMTAALFRRRTVK